MTGLSSSTRTSLPQADTKNNSNSTYHLLFIIRFENEYAAWPKTDNNKLTFSAARNILAAKSS